MSATKEKVDFDPLRNPDLFGGANDSFEPAVSKVETRVIDSDALLQPDSPDRPQEAGDLFANSGGVSSLFGDMSIKIDREEGRRLAKAAEERKKAKQAEEARRLAEEQEKRAAERAAKANALFGGDNEDAEESANDDSEDKAAALFGTRSKFTKAGLFDDDDDDAGATSEHNLSGVFVPKEAVDNDGDRRGSDAPAQVTAVEPGLLEIDDNLSKFESAAAGSSSKAKKNQKSEAEQKDSASAALALFGADDADAGKSSGGGGGDLDDDLFALAGDGGSGGGAGGDVDDSFDFDSYIQQNESGGSSSLFN